MNQQQLYYQKSNQYRSARGSLLTIVLLSVINVFSMIFSGSYFLFSAYLPQLFIYMGLDLAAESGDSLFLIVAGVFAVIVVVPYLLCWIFSKKHVGWMIGALCMFSLDSVLFLFDFVAFLQAGDFTMIIDLLIRVWAIVSLILGVKHGLAAKKEAENAPLEATPAFAENGDAAPDAAYSGLQRPITLARQKAFAASLVPMACYVNGKEVCVLKNGESQTVYAPEEAFELKVMLVAANNGAFGVQPAPTQGSITVDAGTAPLTYTLRMKSGLTTATIEITQS
jgi:hypothetical protein